MSSVLTTMTEAQKKELKQSLHSIRTGDYKGTAIKVELEAQLHRPGRGSGTRPCEDCSGNGYIYCEADGCDDGYVPHGCGDDCPYEFCDDGFVPCESCEGEDRTSCESCEGIGNIPTNDHTDWTTDGCRRYLLDSVPAPAKKALIFSHFYNDGSVDSEFTFTLPIEKAHMAVYFIEAFAKMAKVIEKQTGMKANTSGAGMHIAILNSPDGYYPDGNYFDSSKASNFKQAMIPLLPAMLFLGSATHASRGLRYRPPEINLDGKMGVVGGGSGVFEYRVFETCYERPLAFIDFVIVIANTLKFYKSEPTDTSMKLGDLGIKDGSGVERFYYTLKHLEALDRGLALLKPQYKSITQLKKERGFNISKSKLEASRQRRVNGYKKEFSEIKQRRRFERLRLYHAGVTEAYQVAAGGSKVEIAKYARDYVDRFVKDPTYALKGDVKQYIKQQEKKFMSENIDSRITV